jgi:phage shock protein C
MNRRLYRSPDDRILAGVAGGMAETYDMDPAVVRIVWTLLIIFTGGVFLLLYVVMALVVPLRGDDEPLANTSEGDVAGTDDTTQAGAAVMTAREARRARRGERRASDNSGPLILGALLVIVGGIFLFRQYFNIDIGQLWPLAIIGLGVVLIFGAFGRGGRKE